MEKEMLEEGLAEKEARTAEELSSKEQEAHLALENLRALEQMYEDSRKESRQRLEEVVKDVKESLLGDVETQRKRCEELEEERRKIKERAEVEKDEAARRLDEKLKEYEQLKDEYEDLEDTLNPTQVSLTATQYKV